MALNSIGLVGAVSRRDLVGTKFEDVEEKDKKASGINHQVALNVMDKAYLSVWDTT